MRFDRWPMGERFAGIKDFERMIAEQAPNPDSGPSELMTLFPDLAELTRLRSARWSAEARYLRERRAREWRDIRKVLSGLPHFTRQVVLAQWAGQSARRVFSGSPRGFREFATNYFPYLVID